MSLRLALLTLCAGSLVIYAGAMRLWFVGGAGKLPSRMVGISGFFVITGAIHLMSLATGQLTIGRSAVAVTLYGLALLTFFWALHANRRRPLSVAWSQDAPVHLVESGPYRFIRHPFYAAYCATWLAGAFAVANIGTITSSLAMVLVYLQAARYEERKFLRGALAASYSSYMARTGRFIPSALLLQRRRRVERRRSARGREDPQHSAHRDGQGHPAQHHRSFESHPGSASPLVAQKVAALADIQTTQEVHPRRHPSSPGSQ